jgi:hypothetical protein
LSKKARLDHHHREMQKGTDKHQSHQVREFAMAYFRASAVPLTAAEHTRYAEVTEQLTLQPKNPHK